MISRHAPRLRSLIIFRILAPTLLLFFFLLIAPAPTNAQTTWSYTCDFTITPGIGWASGYYYTSTWVNGVGWKANAGDFRFSRNKISITPGDWLLTGWSVRQNVCSGPGAGGVLFQGDGNASWTDISNPACYSSGGYIYTGQSWPAGIGGNWTYFQAGADSVYLGGAGYTAIEWIHFEGTGTVNPFGRENCLDEPPPELIKPLAYDDEHDAYQLFSNAGALDWGQYYRDNLDDSYWFFPVSTSFDHYGAYGISNEPGQKVHAAGAGTVESVVPFNPAQCAIGIADATLEAPYTIILESPECVASLPVLSDTFGRSEITSFDTAGVFLVTLVLDPIGEYEFTITYIVANANLYVQAGDSILGGCVLGETIGYASGASLDLSLSVSIGPISVSTSVVKDRIFSQGFTVLQGYDTTTGETIDIITMLSIYPDNDSPCGGSGEFADCLTGNPNFSVNGNGWTASNYVQWLNPGVLLSPQAILYQFLALDTETTSYTMVLQAKAIGGAGLLRLFAGYASETPVILEEFSTYSVIVMQGAEPDSGLEFTSGVENIGNTDIEINYICMQAGDNAIDPGVCLFPQTANWTDDWSGTGAVVEPGQFLLGDGATIDQSMTLTQPGDYKITVLTSLWSNASLWDLGGESQIALKWTYGAAPQETFTPNPATWAAFSRDSNINFTDTLTIAGPTTETFTIEVDIVNAPATTKGLAILGVCISLEPEGGTIEPPLHSDCKVVTRPTTPDLWRWIEYLWMQLNRFFQCDLMVLLNKQFTMLDNARLTLMWSIRWGQSTTTLGSQWLGKYLIGWLNGHFRNMAYGQVTTIEQSGGVSLWDVILALINGVFAPLTTSLGRIVELLVGLVSQVANLFFAIVTGGISLALAFITQLLSLLTSARELLGLLISAYNTATPAEIAGLPTCLDLRSHPICIGVHITDNTIFRPGSSGNAIIPAIVSILSINLILWVIKEIKQTVAQIGQNT